MPNAYVRPIVAATIALLPVMLVLSAVMDSPLWTGVVAWVAVALVAALVVVLLRGRQRS